MPITLTLTIDEATFAAMQAGEPVTLKAALKTPKPRAAKPLDPALVPIRDECLALWTRYQPEHDPGRVWKALAKAAAPGLADAVATALDYNEGRSYAPEWFVKDVAMWAQRAQLDPFAQMDDRARYRAKWGMKG